MAVDSYPEQNDALKGLITYSGILILKMIAVAFLTSFWKIKNKATDNPEDIKVYGRDLRKDAMVERVRRAHRNDIENIIPFMIFGYYYTLSNPETIVALMLFRTFTIARFCHTIFFAVVPIAPLRSINFLVGLGVLCYMIVNTVGHYATF